MESSTLNKVFCICLDKWRIFVIEEFGFLSDMKKMECYHFRKYIDSKSVIAKTTIFLISIKSSISALKFAYIINRFQGQSCLMIAQKIIQRNYESVFTLDHN